MAMTQEQIDKIQAANQAGQDVVRTAVSVLSVLSTVNAIATSYPNAIDYNQLKQDQAPAYVSAKNALDAAVTLMEQAVSEL